MIPSGEMKEYLLLCANRFCTGWDQTMYGYVADNYLRFVSRSTKTEMLCQTICGNDYLNCYGHVPFARRNCRMWILCDEIMKEIIDDPNCSIITKFKEKATYTQQEIDALRIEWAKYVDEFIPIDETLD